MSTSLRSAVAQVEAAPSQAAFEYFAERFAFETDCADVAASLASGYDDFVLVDVRSPKLFAQGHVPGALNIPHADLTVERLAEFPKEKLMVVYCAGPHCNGAQKAARRLAELERPVKEMIGGMTGWRCEGFEVAT